MLEIIITAQITYLWPCIMSRAQDLSPLCRSQLEISIRFRYARGIRNTHKSIVFFINVNVWNSYLNFYASINVHLCFIMAKLQCVAIGTSNFTAGFEKFYYFCDVFSYSLNSRNQLENIYQVHESSPTAANKSVWRKLHSDVPTIHAKIISVWQPRLRWYVYWALITVKLLRTINMARPFGNHIILQISKQNLLNMLPSDSFMSCFSFPNRIFYKGVPGFATDCPCGV